MKLFKRFKQIFRAGRIYFFDLKNDVRYSSLCTEPQSQQEMLLSSLVVAAHTIEKGLTMPKRRFPFGEAKAMEILINCQEYVQRGYDLSESRFIDVVGIMQEYRAETNNRVGPNSKIDYYVDLLSSVIPQTDNLKQCYHINRDDYFSHNFDGFESFSISRHSCRNLSGHVRDEDLKIALSLSMNAPSTCNRQSHRIHLLQSDEAKRSILGIQSGNRGFGDIVDQFVLVTSDLRCWPSQHQRNAPYVDGGIYVMNLLYCLHCAKIAACTLNLFLDKGKTQRLHDELGIPQNEVPIALIAIGVPPEQFDLARSHRRGFLEVTTIH